MSTLSTRDASRNQLAADRDVAKIFIGNNSYEKVTFKNTTGAPLTLEGGEIIGRITDGGADNLKGKILASASADGSQFPLGINRTCTNELADGEEVEINVCVEGYVAKEKVVFDGADNLDTVIAGKTLGDRLKSDTVGIILKDSIELGGFDN